MRRRLLLRVALPAILALAMLVLPTSTLALSPPYYPGLYCTPSDSASHGCNTRLSTLSYYKGWASMDAACHGGAEPGLFIAPQAPHDAWRWTNGGWQRTTLWPGARVYIWPYAVNWSWAWTQDTGWLAVHDSAVMINRWCPAVPMAR